MSKLLRDHGIANGAFPVAIIILTIFAILPGVGWGQPITEGFNNFDTGTRPAGWTFNGCNANSDSYTGAGDYGLASPSIKLDTTGDYIQTQTFFHPNALTFWVKGVATDVTSALLVEEYYSGTGWNTLTNVTNLPDPGLNLGPYSMNFFATEARFTYSKSAGDVAVDDVGISAAAATPTATPSVPPTATLTLTPPPSPTPTPYTDFPNPSFEIGDLDNWLRVGTASGILKSVPPEPAYDGTYSCRFKDPNKDAYDARGVRSTAVGITAGRDYNFSGWFYTINEGSGSVEENIFKFDIEWLDIGMNIIYTDSDEGWSVTTFDTWEKREYINVTAPVGAVYVRIYLAVTETTVNDNDSYIDLFSVIGAPAIEVTAPVIGDAWYIGDSENITWDSVGISTNIDLHYSTNGTDWSPVAINIVDTSSYAWTIPNDPSSQAVIRVRETGGLGVSDESDQFTIGSANSINVESPAAGEELYYGTTFGIVWTHGPGVLPANNIDLSYSDDGGSSWTTIATGVGLDTSPYSWAVPDVVSSNCLVRVCQQFTSICGESGVFTIATPTFTVTSPSGGETWYLGDSENITWTYTAGISGNVDIDYSTNGISGPWAEIASNQPNSGSNSWSIPNDSSSTCRVRISEVGGISDPGISAADFTIVGAPVPPSYLKLGWIEMPAII